MGQRNIERAVARKLYDCFSLKWRREARVMGSYGKRGMRKPTFHQWYEAHMRDETMMKESTPADVREHFGIDPWGDSGHEGTEHPPTDSSSE